MRRLALLGAAALAVMPCSSDDGDAADLTSVDGFIEWLGDHESEVSIVVLSGPSLEVAFAHRADEPRPLASVRKILILGAYADALAAGELRADERVSLADVERWWIPGTDGGAHDQAVDEAEREGWLTDGRVTLDRLAWAMTRWSDNAAADYLLERVGPERTEAFATDRDMTKTGRLGFGLGEFLAWSQVDADELLGMSADERSAVAADLSSTRGPVQGILPPDLATQRRLALSSPTTGTAAEWARLMGRLGTDDDDSTAVAMREHLEWPRAAFPQNRIRFERFGIKGGSLPGVLAEAAFVRPTGGELIAVALFLDGLALDDWRTLSQTFVDQQLIVGLAEDPPLVDRLADALG